MPKKLIDIFVEKKGRREREFILKMQVKDKRDIKKNIEDKEKKDNN